MLFTTLGRAAHMRRCRGLCASLVTGALIVMPAVTASAQSARSREDLVARLAGRRIKLDQITGQARAITAQEARDLVAAVLRATTEPDPARISIRGAAGHMLRLGDHAGHIVVVRADEDGSVSMRCVGSADEAVAFLTEDALPLQ